MIILFVLVLLKILDETSASCSLDVFIERVLIEPNKYHEVFDTNYPYSTGFEHIKSAPITNELVCRNISSFDQINVDQPQLAHLKILKSYINLNNATVHRKLPEIRRLWIETNGSYFLNVSIFHQFPDLQELNLPNNKIMEIYTGQFQDLALVNLSHNYISVFNTSVFKNVKTVILHNNHIGHISFKKDESSYTTLLDLSNNYLTVLEEGFLVGFQKLKTLLLKGNLFVGIPSFIDAKHLSVINLSYNFLSVLDCSMFNNRIRAVVLNNNMLMNFTSCYNLTELAYLNLSHNNLSLIPHLHSNILQLLDLSYNNISDVSLENFKGVLPMKLDLSFNNISNIPDKMLHDFIYTEDLNMSHNRMLTIKNFKWSLVNVQANFSNNNIQKVVIDSEGQNQVTQTYYLHHNNITNLNFLRQSPKEYFFVLSGNGFERNCSQIQLLDEYFNTSVVDAEDIYNAACGHAIEKVEEVVEDVIVNLTGWINETVLNLQKNIDQERHMHITDYLIFAILVVVFLILLVAVVVLIKHNSENRYHNLVLEHEMRSLDRMY